MNTQNHEENNSKQILKCSKLEQDKDVCPLMIKITWLTFGVCY